MITTLLRRCFVGAPCVCLFTCAAASAAGPVAVDEESQALDQTVQALKQEVVDLDSRGQDVEQALLYPAYTRTNVYLGVAVKGLFVKTLSVSVDDAAPTVIRYTEDEARNLLDGKPAPLHRVLRVNAAPGTHRLKADFTAKFFDAKEDTPALTGHYEAFFNKDSRPSELELSVEGGSFGSAPTLTLRDWRPSR